MIKALVFILSLTHPTLDRPYVLIDVDSHGHVTRHRFPSLRLCRALLRPAPAISTCDAGDINAYEGTATDDVR